LFGKVEALPVNVLQKPVITVTQRKEDVPSVSDEVRAAKEERAEEGEERWIG